MFGAKPVGTATPQFSFGASTPAKTGLFGSATATSTATGGSLFGTTTQVPSAGTLFGATGGGQSAGLFGSPKAAAPATTLFNMATSTGQTSTSGNLFPTTVPTTTTSLFNKQVTTTSGPLFNSTNTSSLFGTANTNMQQQQQTSQQSGGSEQIVGQMYLPALVKSVQQAQLYGDERDNIITWLNQLLAASGTSASVYWHASQPPLPLPFEQPFNRFVTIVYHAQTISTDADGLCALIVRGRTVQELNGQRQQFIDALARLFGSRPSLRVVVNSVKPTTSNDGCEVVIYVEEQSALGTAATTTRRICASELHAFLSQQHIRTQLQQQMSVGDIVAHVALDAAGRAAYLRTPPAGIDLSVWRTACANNPQPRTLLPVVVRGMSALHDRARAQNDERQHQTLYIDRLRQRCTGAQLQATGVLARLDRVCGEEDQLAHRLVNIVCAQWLRSRRGCAFDSAEQELAGRVDDVHARLTQPSQLRSRLNDVMCTVRSQPHLLHAAQRRAQTQQTEDVLDADEKTKLEILAYMSCVRRQMTQLQRQVQSDARRTRRCLEHLIETGVSSAQHSSINSTTQ